jgi:uncharacterized protein
MAQWQKIGSRGTVQDRRGMGPVVGGSIGLGGLVLLIAINFLFGGDVGDVIGDLNNVQVQDQQAYSAQDFEGADEYETFASTVLGSANDTWKSLFEQNGKTYREPTLVLFRSATPSGCGTATSRVGPHYCPLDYTIYLDETFFDDLKTRLGAEGGDVAEAYVIAHEVAHHVQNELGIMDQVRELQQAHPSKENDLSIQLELQADCFAGLWAHSIKDLGVFTPGEIREAIDAAAAVGDDSIQERVTGQINPETWTHGSSAERVNWFTKGYETGSYSACNTLEGV